MFRAVSTNSTSIPLVRLGTGSTPETSGYVGSVSNIIGATTTSSNSGAGVQFGSASAANVYSGKIVFDLEDLSDNTWTYDVSMAFSNAAGNSIGAGYKPLAGTLDMVRLTTTNGTDAFDAGEVSLSYEG